MSDEIGGQFNMAKQIPGKEEFYETLRYFNKRIEKDGVDLKLSTKVDANDLIDFDSGVICTGVTPRDLNIPGIEHPNVLSYVDVLANKADVGENVVVVGAGGIGFDVAEYLTHEHLDPDENHEDFMKTYNLLNDLKVSYFHVFSYSERKNTEAEKIKEKIFKNEISQRRKKLQELSK